MKKKVCLNRLVLGTRTAILSSSVSLLESGSCMSKLSITISQADVPFFGAQLHYFRNPKTLTLLAFFSSKIGSTQAREYVPLSGTFEAYIPYNQGTKVWAT